MLFILRKKQINDVRYVTTVNELAFLSAAEQFLLYTRFLMQLSGQDCVKQQKKLNIFISSSPVLPAGLIHHQINVNPANLNKMFFCNLPNTVIESQMPFVGFTDVC